MVLMESLLLFSRTVLPCSHLAWSNFSVSAYQLLPILYCWKYAYIQSVPKRMTAPILQPIVLFLFISYLSKTFESLFNMKSQRHLSAHNFLSDCQYGIRSECSTGDLLAFFTNYWSSSGFGETFALALYSLKTFDRVWHKALFMNFPLSVSILPSAPSSLISFLTVVLLLCKTTTVLSLNLSIVVFYCVVSYHPLIYNHTQCSIHS